MARVFPLFLNTRHTHTHAHTNRYTAQQAGRTYVPFIHKQNRSHMCSPTTVRAQGILSLTRSLAGFKPAYFQLITANGFYPGWWEGTCVSYLSGMVHVEGVGAGDTGACYGNQPLWPVCVCVCVCGGGGSRPGGREGGAGCFRGGTGV